MILANNYFLAGSSDFLERESDRQPVETPGSYCVQHRNNPAQNPESKIPADIFTLQFSYLWTETDQLLHLSSVFMLS